MNLYYYNGPVLEFERIVADHWSASTRAPTEKKLAQIWHINSKWKLEECLDQKLLFLEN